MMIHLKISRFQVVVQLWIGVILFTSLNISNALFAAAATPNNSRDIAIIDRALATAKGGDTYVKFGDCGMRISDLQTFRSRLVDEQTPHTGPRPLAATPNPLVKWTNGIIPYRFDPTQVSNGTLTAAKMQQLRDSAAEWSAFANVQFQEFTGTPPANFVTIQESSDGSEGGFSSAVGMGGGEQFLQCGPHSWNRGTLCHELGHVLGLIHEQQRDDRDTYVVIDWNNISTDEQANFTKLPGGATSIGAYDFYSVMHYSHNALAIDPSQDTITMQPAYAQYEDIIGMVYDRTLSTLDRAGMGTLYGAPLILPGAVVTNTNDGGPGSLRTAIYFAFDQSTKTPPVTTTISFKIPKTDPNFSGTVFTIKPTYSMPAPGNGTTIDGTTQTTSIGNTNPSGPEVVIDGTMSAQYEQIGSGFVPPFILRQVNCTVKGFNIRNWDAQGVEITGAATTGNTVSGCYIGTDETGTTAMPNAYSGVEILGGAHGNTVGGTAFATSRNVISGNTQVGVVIHDAGSNANRVAGNYIGLNAAGTAAIANAGDGVLIYNGAQSNNIGGTTTIDRNVISGNLQQGIVIADPGTNSNVMLGNYIGLNAAGNAAVGNGFADTTNNVYYPGIGIFNGAQKNTIGGNVTGTTNVISGNAGGGVSISGTNTNSNVVQGNFIGTNPGGTSAIANGNANPSAFYLFAGVELFGGAASNTIGSLSAIGRNIISGNGAQGIFIGDFGTNLNVVQGNYIGTDVTGAKAIANGYSGVGVFNSAASNTIGGTVTGSRNVISGNTEQGIAMGDVASGQTVGPKSNLIQGNYVGVTAGGSGVLGNGSAGVNLFGGSQSNTIGGTAAGARNVIAGNAFQDVAISDEDTNSNLVVGNYIGLDATGLITITNNNTGVAFFGGTQKNVLGGTAAEARNYIAGHAQYGVTISDSGTTGNLVQGNSIGVNLSGAAAPNGYQGIALFGGSQSNTIGGTAVGASNLIADNTAEGVGVFDNTTLDNTISENSIFGNSPVGIGVYTGSNNGQVAPTITSAVLSTATNPGGTDVSGSLSSAASTTYRIEFFASASGNEGQTFVGSTSVKTDTNGAASFTVSLAAALPSGYVVTATATDPTGDTSPFSATSSVTTVDSNSDGLPDNWMMAHFGHTTALASDLSRPTDDADGDGMTNLQEFLAGTDPKSATSTFRITNIDKTGGSPRISFPALAGKTYQLQYSNDLLSAKWYTLVDGIFSATNTPIQIVDVGAASATKRFYRVALDQNLTVVTDPVGLLRQTFLAASDTIASIPFIRPPQFIGGIQSVSGSVINVSGTPGWTNNQFVYAAGTQTNHYYALIGTSVASDPKLGHRYDITANGANTLTVDTTGDSLTGIPANAQVIIVPYWTPATIFPAADIGVTFSPSSSSSAYKTTIEVPNDSASGINLPYAPVYFYAKNVDGTTNVGWRVVGDNNTYHGDDPLQPDGYFVDHSANGAPALGLPTMGAVLLKKLVIPLATSAAGQQDNPVCVVRPATVDLNETGLGPADGSFVANDQLLIFNNAVASYNKAPSAIYYYDTSVGNTGGWRLTGDPTTNHGNDAIPTGTGFIIRKAPTASGQTVLWTNPFP